MTSFRYVPYVLYVACVCVGWKPRLYRRRLTEDVEVAVDEAVSVLVAGVTLDDHQVVGAAHSSRCAAVVLAYVDDAHRQSVVTPTKLVRRRVVRCATTTQRPHPTPDIRFITISIMHQ